MLTELCAYLRNYFLADNLKPDKYIHHGTFTVAGGQMQALSFLVSGQYFRVIGSVFNDGVWQYRPAGEAPAMKDETFDGTIWAMSVPGDVLDLANEIEDWRAANADALSSPYQSESFGGYSYSKASGGGVGGSGSGAYGWQDQFAARLAPYKRRAAVL